MLHMENLKIALVWRNRMRKQRAPRVDSRLNDMRRGEQKRNIPRKQRAVEGQSSESPQNPHPKRRTSLQAGLAVLGGRTAGALSRRLHLGGGTSIAGLVAQKVYPDIVGHLATQLEFGR